MRWNKERVDFWIENYYGLKDYSIDFMKERKSQSYDKSTIPRGVNSTPFEDQILMNAEFVLALRYMRKTHGNDLTDVLGLSPHEARGKNWWGVSRLAYLLIHSDSTDWLSEVI